ncbi:MAG: hypothetical protein KGI38_11265 [Thaumarchaeota archaeon]|nr:hypothetical protein [Nitrososphaerota archaeon]
MSGRGSPPKTLLADTDLFFFYLRGGSLERQAEEVIGEAESGMQLPDFICSLIRANPVSQVVP